MNHRALASFAATMLQASFAGAQPAAPAPSDRTAVFIACVTPTPPGVTATLLETELEALTEATL